MKKFVLGAALALGLMTVSAPASAQWIIYPTPVVPIVTYPIVPVYPIRVPVCTYVNQCSVFGCTLTYVCQ